MTTQKSDKWMAFRHEVKQRAQRLAFRFGGPGPAVALRRIAEECGIKEVVFRPLLVSGGLAIDGDKLVMFVKCDAEDVVRCNTAFLESGGLDLIPRMRFTIAHEIAHTFFITRKRDGTLVPRISGKHPKELDSLEQACDYAAGILLLPQDRLQEFFESADFLSPHSIKAWVGAFRVSPEAFIRRLDELSNWNNARGAVALVRADNRELRIKALAIDGSTRRLLGHARTTANPRDLAYAAELEIYGGDLLSTEVSVMGAIADRVVPVPCVVSCLPLQKSRSSYLFTMRLKD